MSETHRELSALRHFSTWLNWPAAALPLIDSTCDGKSGFDFLSLIASSDVGNSLFSGEAHTAGSTRGKSC